MALTKGQSGYLEIILRRTFMIRYDALSVPKCVLSFGLTKLARV